MQLASYEGLAWYEVHCSAPKHAYECRLDRYDTIGAPSARKLSALALCVLLTLPLPALLERLDVILPHITGTWLEVRMLCCGLHVRAAAA